jgi:hypothetical protein
LVTVKSPTPVSSARGGVATVAATRITLARADEVGRAVHRGELCAPSGQWWLIPKAHRASAMVMMTGAHR